MFNLRNKKGLAIAALGLLVILACKTVQINVQVNIGLTSTATASAVDQTMTSPAISETPAFAVVSPTGTFTPSPEPVPRLVPGQPISITGTNMAMGWGMEASGHILHTLDGGRTWSDVTPPQSSYSAFYAEDPNIAWAVSELRSWQTTNAGRSWQPGEQIDLGDIDVGKCGPLHFGRVFTPQVWFIDGTQGWMVVTADAVEHGYTVTMLFSTIDAGTHWDLKYLSTRDCSTSDGPEGLWSILFKTPTQGWGGFVQDKFTYYPYNQERYVGGWDLYRTTDAGASWEAVTLPEPPGFLEETVKSENAQEVATCGVTRIVPFAYEVFGLQMRCFITPTHAFQYYYLTFNNGLDWTAWPATGGEEFVVDPYRDYKATGWRFVRSTTGGLSEIQQTLDRGHTWNTIKKVAWDSASFDFVDEQNGWALVTAGMNTMFLKTTDGGRSWELLAPSVVP